MTNRSWARNDEVVWYNQNMDLSVLIVTYNSENEISNCLDSLLPSLQKLKAEILVWDNCSRDRTTEAVKMWQQVHRFKSSQLKIFKSQKNLGWPKANNQLFKKARGRNLLLLNPDTVVVDDAIAQLSRFLDQNQKAGAAGPRLLSNDKTPIVSIHPLNGIRDVLFGSRLYQGWRYPVWFRRLFKFLPPREDFIDICFFEHSIFQVEGWASGACFMLKKSVYQKIGPKDEKFFFFGEESDWCAKILGLKHQNKIYYLPSAQVYHLLGKSSSLDRVQNNYRGVKITYKNRLYYAKKHFPKFPKSIIWLFFRIELIIKIISRFLSPRISWLGKRARIKTYWEIFQGKI